uniref:DNA/RNA-binding protein Alba-like domain-containing protein n=1 Tax=Euplotes harpa TaxID=151035 RepID=A0A7S3N7T5_9SPIT|mmetsp:Transcript_2073/g.2619  ORF Transcript_2073/g.2619 Transcript_2073/m.2619 type:complete len:119 (+) Transcript_2073:38-394(+)|eukprot:CAMPEP_0168326960 /NCGR_PEP_ID=MMETSP0213-20121227/5621_1 /TAXON_ID=151035 /ORGANISM="Euplotes harpa, Strain FSP1.4" /LENGTH=118 /DNA_ID=CAMNT_0008329789 /DNA_START=19 /DNA_END=375 /DNA_ORIENTATION=+
MEKAESKESDNVVRVGVRRNWTFYTFLAKKLFTEHDTVEFQALDTAITNAVEAAECLVKNKYATIEKMYTDSIDMERKAGGKIKKAKIFIVLKKGEDFQKIYDDYEKERSERLKTREE